MRSFFISLIIIHLSSLASSGDSPLNITGYYNLANHNLTTRCDPYALIVKYINFTNSTSIINTSNLQFDFLFPHTINCYDYSIYGNYSIIPSFMQIHDNSTIMYVWHYSNYTCKNSGGIITISSYNISISAQIFQSCQLVSYSQFVMINYILSNPPIPNIPEYLSIHEYLYPNYISSTSCYPERLEVKHMSNDELFFTWIWQNSSSCASHGLLDPSQGVIFLSFSYFGTWNWTFFDLDHNVTIYGSWSVYDQMMQVSFIHPIYTGFTMVRYIPPALSLDGCWSINRYLIPKFYSSDICYPTTFHLQSLNSYGNLTLDKRSFSYSLYIDMPCTNSCQTICGQYNTQLDLILYNGEISSLTGIISLPYIYFSGRWNVLNNTLTIDQRSQDIAFSYMLIRTNSSCIIKAYS